MPELLIIAVSVFAVLSLILFFYGRSHRTLDRKGPAEKSAFGGEFAPSLEREFDRLGIPKQKAHQAANRVSVLVDQELRRQQAAARQEVRTTYEKLIQDKDRAIESAQEKFVTMDRDYKKLGHAKKRTEKVVRSLSEGRVVVDSAGTLLETNEVAEKILGGSREDFAGKPVSSLSGQQRVISFIHEMTEAEEEALTLLSDDPIAQRRIRECSAVIENESGEARGFISILPQPEIFNESDEIKKEFVTGISDDIRTPLVCIQKAVEACLEEGTEKLSDTQKGFLVIAQRNGEKLAAMVNQMLSFSHLEGGQVVLHPTVFMASDFVSSIQKRFSGWADRKGIALRSFCQDSALVLEADRLRLAEVMNQLLSNALKFTPPGGKVELAVQKAASGTPRVPAGKSFVEFRIYDTGPGITEEQKDRIFEKFSRGSRPSSPSEPGVGLGLAIAREIIELHGGWVVVDSTPGQGSCFSIFLPQYSFEASEPDS